MKVVHLIFYSFYKTALLINRIVPLKGGCIGGTGLFMALLTVVPIAFLFKLSKKSASNFEIGYKYVITLVVIGIVIFYFDDRGINIIKKLEGAVIPNWHRIVLANGFLILYFAAFMFFLK